MKLKYANAGPDSGTSIPQCTKGHDPSKQKGGVQTEALNSLNDLNARVTFNLSQRNVAKFNAYIFVLIFFFCFHYTSHQLAAFIKRALFSECQRSTQYNVPVYLTFYQYTKAKG